jgi:hypothetical protein
MNLLQSGGYGNISYVLRQAQFTKYPSAVVVEILVVVDGPV